nr:type III secretion system outer membrane ring subunit SctC [uncultured Enterobacter sp.]
MQQTRQESTPDNYVIKDKSIDYLFKALSARLKKPIISSAKAKKYSVSGNFNLNEPAKALTKVTADLGLIWYFDGSIFYVYESSEATSAVVQFAKRNFSDLVSFLVQNQLYDDRYPIKMNFGANTLYVSGPPKYVDIITAIASLMQDQGEENVQQQVIETIKLRYAFVDDRNYQYRDRQVAVPGVATTLNDLLSESNGNRAKEISAAKKLTENSPETANSSAPVGQKALFDQFAFSQLSGEVRVVPFTGRNSLMVKGTRAQVNMIKDLIATLDTPRKQVELSLWIIDISKDDLDALGVSWDGQFSLGDKIAGLVNTTTILSSTQQDYFLAKVSALSQNEKANVVSRPFLLAQENMPALFDNTKSFYVRLAGENNVELETVTYGTTIGVTPMISDNNKVIEMTLDIMDGTTSVSQDGTSEQVDNLPVVSNTSINTLARVTEGQSLMVGGYTRDQVQLTTTKVPLLGDIPLVGNLFKSSGNTVSKTVRLFLIQPKIIKDFSTDKTNINDYINKGWDAINDLDAQYSILNPGKKAANE